MNREPIHEVELYSARASAIREHSESLERAALSLEETSIALLTMLLEDTGLEIRCSAGGDIKIMRASGGANGAYAALHILGAKGIMSIMHTIGNMASPDECVHVQRAIEATMDALPRSLGGRR
jgi:hypothetical protein